MHWQQDPADISDREDDNNKILTCACCSEIVEEQHTRTAMWLYTIYDLSKINRYTKSYFFSSMQGKKSYTTGFIM